MIRRYNVVQRITTKYTHIMDVVQELITGLFRPLPELQLRQPHLHQDLDLLKRINGMSSGSRHVESTTPSN